MGQSVLTYQFVAGLVDPKLVGAAGTFDELLAKVHLKKPVSKELDPIGKRVANSIEIG